MKTALVAVRVIEDLDGAASAHIQRVPSRRADEVVPRIRVKINSTDVAAHIDDDGIGRRNAPGVGDGSIERRHVGIVGGARGAWWCETEPILGIGPQPIRAVATPNLAGSPGHVQTEQRGDRAGDHGAPPARGVAEMGEKGAGRFHEIADLRGQLATDASVARRNSEILPPTAQSGLQGC